MIRMVCYEFCVGRCFCSDFVYSKVTQYNYSKATVPLFSLKKLIFLLFILPYIFAGCELRKAEALVDLSPVKSFTVRRQEIHYCKKPEQTGNFH